MKVIITRAFSKTYQLRQFEPINAQCSVSIELDADSLDAIAAHSEALDAIARAEVEKTIEAEKDAKAACVNCGGIQRYGGKGVNAEGRCEACEADYQAKRREHAKDSKKAAA